MMLSCDPSGSGFELATHVDVHVRNMLTRADSDGPGGFAIMRPRRESSGVRKSETLKICGIDQDNVLAGWKMDELERTVFALERKDQVRLPR